MAKFIDEWVWEPTDCIILQCAVEGISFPCSNSYRMQTESLQVQGFLKIASVRDGRMTAIATPKGEETAKMLFGDVDKSGHSC